MPQPNQPAPEKKPGVCISIPGQQNRNVLIHPDTVTIGRDPSNTIVVEHKNISRHHAYLEWDGHTWHYIDLQSHNGSYIRGRGIQRVALKDGDTISLGSSNHSGVTLTYRTAMDAQTADTNSGADTIHVGTTIIGQKPSLLIGRDPRCDIPLESPTVSRHHARIENTARGNLLLDMGSANGTFVNGQRIRRRHLLHRGDIIQIGAFRLEYDGISLQQYAAIGGMRIEGRQLIRDVGKGKKQKRILKNVDICIYPREFVALVGPSGAGKSTLMKALSGFERTQGLVLVDGDDLYQRFDIYRAHIGYVPQDDIIHKDLAVCDVLCYAAQLRLPSDTSRREIEQRIRQVLQQVELESHKSKKITELSGGQRKRVSIAVELLADPGLFFLDEPTSGLDPGLEQKMMQMLRKLARGEGRKKGQTVVLVTHATANISECDHVCFMAQGRIAYFGPPDEALQFFGVPESDPGGFAAIYNLIDDPDIDQARQKALYWEKRYKQSPQYRHYILDRSRSPSPISRAGVSRTERQLPSVDLWKQFLILTQRYMSLVVRDKVLLTILLAIMPLMGMLLAIVADPAWLIGDSATDIARELSQQLVDGEVFASYMVVHKGQQLIFMLSLAVLMLGLFATAYEIVKERAIYRRERMVVLRLVPYLASKVVVLGAFALVQCLLLLVVVGMRVKMTEQGVIMPTLVEVYITLLLTALGAIMMGLFFSAIAPNSSVVLYIVLPILFFQIIFTGVIFQDIPSALSVPTLTRWSVEALGASTNMLLLNETGRIRFHPDPITKAVEMELEQPDPAWEPVSITTEMQQIAGCAAPVPMPVVTENPMKMVKETVTQSITVTPDLVEKPWKRDFPVLNYDRTAGHLWQSWGILFGYSLLFGIGTLIALSHQEEG